jgi:hypothetical protein
MEMVSVTPPMSMILVLGLPCINTLGEASIVTLLLALSTMYDLAVPPATVINTDL